MIPLITLASDDSKSAAPDDHSPPAVDWEGKALSCSDCPAASRGVQCRLGHACAQDRYAPRIERFFRTNPGEADAWLSHPYFEVRAVAARHATVFRLTALTRDPDETVRTSVAARVPQSVLRQLIGDPEREVRIRVAQRLAPPTLVALAGDKDYYVRVLVARRLPLPLLGRLAYDADRQVRLEVATRLAPSALAFMKDDPEPMIRRLVAQRAIMPLLSELARDEDWCVRYEVATRAPESVALHLSQDPVSDVRAAAFERLRNLRSGTDRQP